MWGGPSHRASVNICGIFSLQNFESSNFFLSRICGLIWAFFFPNGTIVSKSGSFGPLFSFPENPSEHSRAPKIGFFRWGRESENHLYSTIRWTVSCFAIRLHYASCVFYESGGGRFVVWFWYFSVSNQTQNRHFENCSPIFSHSADTPPTAVNRSGFWPFASSCGGVKSGGCLFEKYRQPTAPLLSRGRAGWGRGCASSNLISPAR